MTIAGGVIPAGLCPQLISPIRLKDEIKTVKMWKAPSGKWVFDFGVNAGPKTAVQMLQRVVGTSADGIIVPKTNAAVAAMGDVMVINSYCRNMESFYRALVQAKPKYRKVLNGWLRRAAWKP
jgi:lysozyme family protein